MYLVTSHFCLYKVASSYQSWCISAPPPPDLAASQCNTSQFVAVLCNDPHAPGCLESFRRMSVYKNKIRGDHIIRYKTLPTLYFHCSQQTCSEVSGHAPFKAESSINKTSCVKGRQHFLTEDLMSGRLNRTEWPRPQTRSHNSMKIEKPPGKANKVTKDISLRWGCAPTVIDCVETFSEEVCENWIK